MLVFMGDELIWKSNIRFDIGTKLLKFWRICVFIMIPTPRICYPSLLLMLVFCTFSGVSPADFTNTHNVDIESVHFFDGLVHFTSLVQGLDVPGTDLNCISSF